MKQLKVTTTIILTTFLCMSFIHQSVLPIEIWADSYYASNSLTSKDYGTHVIHNDSDNPHVKNWAIYKFNIIESGEYYVDIEYASNASRPVHVSGDYVGDNVINSNALSIKTGGWKVSHQTWVTVGTVNYAYGIRHLRLWANGVFPHIRKIRLRKKGSLNK